MGIIAVILDIYTHCAFDQAYIHVYENQSLYIR